jgi:hypothetical protein
VQRNTVFWNITPCSPLKVNRRFGTNIACIFKVEEQTKEEISLKQVAIIARLVSCLTYSSTQKMGATCFSEA